MSVVKQTPLEKWAVFWFVFTGVSALIGVGMLWIAPRQLGMTPLLDLMQKNLPFAEVFFKNFAWPGFFLLLFIGIPHLAGIALASHRADIIAWWLIGSGAILIGWTALQIFVAFGPNPLSFIYMLIGFTELTLGVLLVRAQAHNRQS